MMRFMAGNGSEVIGVTAHSSGSLRLACVGVLEHALRLLARRRIIERTVRGRADAKAKGAQFGRKPKLTPDQAREAQKRLAEGETQRSIARSYNVSQATISRLAP